MPASASFLADYVCKPKRLKRFRDKSFVHLQKLDDDHAMTNARLRQTSTQDLHQIISLLRRDVMRAWLQASSSNLLWVNTVKRAGPSDWATTLAIRIIEHAGRLDNMAVLYHLCGNHPPSSQLATPAVMLQSLIMQIIEQNRQQYVRKVPPFTLEHFQGAQDDVHDLWDLFLACCAEAKAPCIWLIVDHFDNLTKGEDYEFIVDALLQIAQGGNQVFKVFISARIAGTPEEILDAAAKVLSINTVTVPKASPSVTVAMLSKQRRAARLPDDSSPERPVAPASKVEIDALLHSSSEDEQLSPNDNGEDSNRLYNQHKETAKSGGKKRVPDVESSDIDGEASDSSMEFMRENLFATTDEDEESDTSPSHPLGHAMKAEIDDKPKEGDDEDEDEELFSFAKYSIRHGRSNDPGLLTDSDLSERSSSV